MMLILDDHPLARQGLCSLIQLYQDDSDILHAGNIKEAVSLMEANFVGLVFIDLNLGKESGFSFLNWIKEKEYKTKVFIITSSSRQSDFKRAQELDVDAYVLKDAFIDEIVYGLKTVERGGKFYSAAIIERINKTYEDEKALDILTEREIEVLSLIGQGFSNAKIGVTLFITESTVKKHITSILSKLELNNRVGAVLLANKNSYSIKMALTKGAKPDSRKKARAI